MFDEQRFSCDSCEPLFDLLSALLDVIDVCPPPPLPELVVFADLAKEAYQIMDRVPTSTAENFFQNLTQWRFEVGHGHHHLGDKLQLLAVSRPNALNVVERYVDSVLLDKSA